jgi:hypothetical protein
MADTSPPGPDMRDLMAAVGEVLLFWGYLETEIREHVARIEPSDAKPSKSPLLARWRKADSHSSNPQLAELFRDIEEVAAIRNYLAHGLSSASANPWSSDELEVVCRLPDGGRGSITLSGLRDAKRRLDSLRIRVRSLPPTN